MVPSSFMISQITADGVQAGEAREVDAGLRLPGALEHAAGARHEREDVARLHQVLRRRIPGSIATWMVCARSAAEMPVVTPSRASTETVNAVCRRASLWAVMGGRSSSAQRCGVRHEAHEPAALLGHEVHLLGGRELRGHREVALVLAVLVVADDDHLALAQIVERLGDGRRTAASAVPRSARRLQSLPIRTPLPLTSPR